VKSARVGVLSIIEFQILIYNLGIYISVSLANFWIGCKIWSPSHHLRVLGNMALMPKRAQQENGENHMMRSFMMSAAHQIVCGLSNEGR